MRLPKVKFSITSSAHEKHFSNSTKRIKLSYYFLCWWNKKQPHRNSWPAELMVFNVFRDETTGEGIDLLDENNISFSKVLPDLTHLFQPSDLTIKKNINDFTKQKFMNWFQSVLNKVLEREQNLDENCKVHYYKRMT